MEEPLAVEFSRAITPDEEQPLRATHIAFSQRCGTSKPLPQAPSDVFVFANDPGGLLVGADFVIREFFSWGAAAASGSPMDVAARATVDAAPTCLN